MRAVRFSLGWGGLFLALWWVLGNGSISVRAEDPDKKDKTEEPEKPAPKAAEKEKLISFEFRDKPWGQVLEWFADQSGIPFISNHKPTGTFTFIPPKGGSRQFSVPQIIDILNEALVAQKYILIRRTASFTLVPADEKLESHLLPRVSVEELAQRGNTEPVQVVLPLTSLVAEDLAPEVKKMLGSPFADVVAISKANQLVLQDTAGNLKRVIKTIKDIEDSEKGQAESYSHTCKYVKAREAERILRELLGDPRELLRALQPPREFGPPGSGSQRPSSTALPKIRMHYISADERTNTVLVTGPADKIAQAREIIKRLDVPQQGQPPVLVGPPVLKTYPVPAGNAEAISKTLQEIYKASSTIRISSVGNNQIMVWAGPDDQFEIAKQILGTSPATDTVTELIPLNALESAKVADTLKNMFGDPKAGGPYVEADASRNALIVKGTAQQVVDVKAALKAIGEGGAAGNVRVITLSQGSAATLAEALERLLPQMRKNPVKVILPGSASPKSSEPEKTPPPKEKPAEPPKEKEKDAQATREVPVARLVSGAKLGSQNVEYVVLADKGDKPPLVDPQDDKKAKTEPPPITIMAFGNQLIVTCDDPQALALVQHMVRILTTPGGEGDFEVIKLKHANAVEAAKILDEAFNGVRRQEQGGSSSRSSGDFGGFFSRFSSSPQPPAPPSSPSTNRIRVVADPATNSLLVRASPLDMLTIRRLLEKAIDTGETDSKAVVRTWLIGPLKYANATEVAGVLRDVYREQINNNPVSTSLGGFSGFSFFSSRSSFVNRNIDASGNPRSVALSIGIDDRTNSLVLACSESMFEDVKRLIDQLEVAAKDSNRTVKVVSIKGIDPVLVQQAIDAIQGRQSVIPSRTSGSGTGSFGLPGMSPGSGFMPGNGGFSPFRGGSFTPGGSRRGPPGSSRGGGSSDLRGPDFFAQRVTDDPQQNPLYDPQLTENSELDPTEDDPRASAREAPSAPSTPLDPRASARGLEEEEQEQQDKKEPTPAPKPPEAGGIRGPRSPVTAEALEQLGVIVISGNNPADVEEVLKIIEYIQKLGAGSELQIQLVWLGHADATSVASTLTRLFQQVIIGATGNVRAPAAPAQVVPGQQGQPGSLQAAPQEASIVLIPLPRFNAILMAAPRARVDDVVKEIERLDRPIAPWGRAIPFPLHKASAGRVATLLQQFYAQRYPNETANQHQVRITFEESTNTVFVQAGPADLDEIRGLIERIDTTVSSAINDLRVVPLQNALADELSNLLMQAISQGLVAPTGLPGIVPGGAGLQGLQGLQGQQGLQQQGLGGLGQLGLGQQGQLGAGLTGAAGTLGNVTKSTTLRFISARPNGKGIVESGLLADIHITPDPRTNSLVVSAPAKTMELILALIRELDVPPASRSEIKIFTLKKADAVNTANVLQQLFLGTSGQQQQPGVTTPTGGGLGGGLQGALGGAGLTGALGAFSGAVGIPRPLLTLGGARDGAPVVELRLTVDERTNSIIVAGSPNDLDVIEALISRLEDSDVQTRHNEVIKLKNASAADVANALQNFLTRSLQVLAQGQQLTAFQEIERDVVIVPEPITNTLLISATPRYFADLFRLIQELDAQPPQVMIQVLIAQVEITDLEEFGVELGLQSPVLFSRGVVPNNGFLGPNGAVNYGTLTTNTGQVTTPGLVPAGVTINNSINPIALPGFNFNSTGPLGNNPVARPGLVGFQGLGNLGVGRNTSGQNFGGFIFSIASDSISLLIRALETQNRLDILSRPQVMTLDNQAARILVGQSFPYTTGTNVTATGVIINNVNYRDIGVQLQVTPRISPDGKVLMRVVPEVSSAQRGSVDLGNGVFATVFNVQTVETTVLAGDGETVAIGGLIQKEDILTDNKIPWLGDLPCVGPLFRFRSQRHRKNELLVILTPHIIRSPFDAERIKAEEARKMDWILGTVESIHGPIGVEGGLPHPEAPAEPVPLSGPGDLDRPEMLPRPQLLPDESPGKLPPPVPVPPPPRPGDGTLNSPALLPRIHAVAAHP